MQIYESVPSFSSMKDKSTHSTNSGSTKSTRICEKDPRSEMSALLASLCSLTTTSKFPVLQKSSPSLVLIQTATIPLVQCSGLKEIQKTLRKAAQIEADGVSLQPITREARLTDLTAKAAHRETLLHLCSILGLTTQFPQSNDSTHPEANCTELSFLPDLQRRDMLSVLSWCIEHQSQMTASCFGSEVQRIVLETLEKIAYTTGPKLLEDLLERVERVGT